VQHILACIGAGERDRDRLARATLEHVRSRDGRGECATTVTHWPCAHRSSA
jgi:hypothetical protein